MSDDDDAFDFDALSDYVTRLFAPEDSVLRELREELRRQGLPEIQVSAEEGRLLQLLLAAIDARRVLEIGTLGGYSAIWMARALPRDGELITLEIEEKHARFAREFARRAQLDHIIDVRVGPALDSLAALQREHVLPFDACFIDADKENYPAYLDHALRLVRPGGLILGDNAFQSGLVLDQENQERGVIAIREFNRTLAENPALLSTVIPVRDGLSLSLVRSTAV